jgi:large subunit ribosomal protein L25
VLYGGAGEAKSLSVDPKEVTGIIRSHGGVNTIFELKVEGDSATEDVMIKEYQIEPVGHNLLHADLIRVAMDKELTLDVGVELVGTPMGVKTGGGMLDFVSRTVEISCLPKDIPETIVVDVSGLDIGHYLRAGDLKVPEGVTLVSDTSLVLVHILEPRAEEVPAEEAAVEGEAAPEGAPAEGEKAESSDESGPSEG